MAFKNDLHDASRFFRAWIDGPMAMGAIAPSGNALTSLVAKQVDPTSPGPVIELGPGTGSMTDALIKRGVDPKRLILIEFNKTFCGLLKDRFKGATVLHADAYQMGYALQPHSINSAAAVVSGLPLYSRPQEERIRLVREAFCYMAPGAPFIQFTYAATSPIPLDTHDIAAEALPLVWLNLPPARVWIYRKKSNRLI
jgi:phosphatidylethanolamine/phosphatidyl-N-methylethanolamine N-methyltransferase